ncbi:MAG: hypothetical protein HOJ51_11465 [Tateyamaria sp.]|nr:hypothetical protein [Tateyamaria sp.]
MCARLLADEVSGPVRALQSLSEAFSGRGRVPPPPPWGIVYRADLRLVTGVRKLAASACLGQT